MAKTYPDIGTFTSGQILTAATMNDVATNLDNFRSKPMCKVKRSVDLSYTSTNAIAWDAEDWDTDGMHDNSTNNSRIVVQTAGLYCVRANIHITYSGTLSNVDWQIKRTSGGTTTEVGYFFLPGSYAVGVMILPMHAMVDAAVNDYFTVTLSISGATSPTVKTGAACWFAAEWMGLTS